MEPELHLGCSWEPRGAALTPRRSPLSASGATDLATLQARACSESWPLEPTACRQFRTLPVMDSKPGETHGASAARVSAPPAQRNPALAAERR